MKSFIYESFTDFNQVKFKCIRWQSDPVCPPQLNSVKVGHQLFPYSINESDVPLICLSLAALSHLRRRIWKTLRSTHRMNVRFSCDREANYWEKAEAPH